MDIYDFFNSPDVAAYCRSIDKKLNALESAVMINQSEKRTLAEKHAAYRVILAEYEDIRIPKSLHHEEADSFHKVLATILAQEERSKNRFMEGGQGALYQANVYFTDEREGATQDAVFTTFEKALANVQEQYEEVEDKVRHIN